MEKTMAKKQRRRVAISDKVSSSDTVKDLKRRLEECHLGVEFRMWCGDAEDGPTERDRLFMVTFMNTSWKKSDVAEQTSRANCYMIRGKVGW